MAENNIPLLKRTRPEAFDEQDAVDPDALPVGYSLAMERRQPEYMTKLLAGNRKRG